MKSLDVEEGGRAGRLVSSAVQLISGQGLAGASARAIAGVAGVSPSAINYNFGGLEHLYLSAFARGVTMTEPWLEARAREIRTLPRTANGAVLALEHVITAWTREARDLALLYQECLVVTPGAGPGAQWTRLWRDFWARTAETFGLGEGDGRLLHAFFESEALYHLSSWSPLLEQAALREHCEHLGAIWLGARPGAATGAAALAEHEAGTRPIGSIAPSATRIVEAAALVVAERGLGGLTHRAVAARAGVTTGAVTHHFRTIEDLVAGAIRGQVMALAQATPGDPPPPPGVEDLVTPESFVAAIRFHAVAEQPAGPAVRRRNLFLAAIRRPELARAGAVIRFAHGGTTRDVLGRLYDLPPPMIPLHAGVLARLLSAIWFACAADPQPRESREVLVTLAHDRLLGQLKLRTA